MAAVPSSRDLRLKGGAPAIDAGTDLPNLNDGFTLSGPPDLGAFEPDLSNSTKQADRPLADFGESVAYTVMIRNSGARFSGTVATTEVVPNALSYVEGSLTATSGVTDDESAPMLR